MFTLVHACMLKAAVYFRNIYAIDTKLLLVCTKLYKIYITYMYKLGSARQKK